jgi:radial spoke head protein 9|eukprot:Tamp_17567.p1 GENE.Tamp_17567~~Tamp_17567.p1  ORF type:complete len:315 (+),score=88.25 Tamp_17567:81-1025(+)
MDADSLSMAAELLASASGHCLTPEERALLPSSLAILKNEHGFSKVYFWGKMQGMQRDYLIAQGLAESAGDKKKEAENGGSDMTVAQFFDTLQAIPKKTFRLGPDGVSWTILPTVTGEMKAQDADWRKSLQATGQVFTPLTGDISHKYEWSTMTGPPAEDDEEKKPTPEAKEMVEDVRLACMVEEIDTATSVIPVGSFILNSSSRVVANPYFRGLDLSAGLKLESYLHLRKPLQLQNAPISERAVLSKSTQFLDALTMDQPKGSWSLKHDAGNKIVVLRSLLYPGYVHWNTVANNTFGGIYIGSGARNNDLAFML